MKKISFVALMLCFTAICFAQNANKPVLTFAEKSFDFGTVKEEAGKITHEFTFTNTGKAPLVIQQVTASCGCTTPAWTKEPVAPGAKGIITVTYSASGRPGSFQKSITVTNNSAENPIILIIKGQVTPKATAQK
ncbi:MAG: putative secreted protein [Bacteroidetes bacterium]|nr:putative secreted protein [Bacteroidota bacterium]